MSPATAPAHVPAAHVPAAHVQPGPLQPADAERGAVTIWLLGMCLVLLVLGGLALDLGRAFSTRRALAGLVDAAAVAGAGALDEAHYRATGEARLDRGSAERRALAVAAAAADRPRTTVVRARAAAEAMTVRAEASVDLTLLRLLVGDRPLRVAVSATVEPRARP